MKRSPTSPRASAARRVLRPGALRQDLRAPARGRLPAEGLALVGRATTAALVGTVRLWHVAAGPAARRCCSARSRSTALPAASASARKLMRRRARRGRGARPRRGDARRRRGLLRALRLLGRARPRDCGCRARSSASASWPATRARRARRRHGPGLGRQADSRDARCRHVAAARLRAEPHCARPSSRQLLSGVPRARSRSQLPRRGSTCAALASGPRPATLASPRGSHGVRRAPCQARRSSHVATHATSHRRGDRR